MKAHKSAPAPAADDLRAPMGKVALQQLPFYAAALCVLGLVSFVPQFTLRFN